MDRSHWQHCVLLFIRWWCPLQVIELRSFSTLSFDSTFVFLVVVNIETGGCFFCSSLIPPPISVVSSLSSDPKSYSNKKRQLFSQVNFKKSKNKIQSKLIEKKISNWKIMRKKNNRIFFEHQFGIRWFDLLTAHLLFHHHHWIVTIFIFKWNGNEIHRETNQWNVKWWWWCACEKRRDKNWISWFFFCEWNKLDYIIV